MPKVLGQDSKTYLKYKDNYLYDKGYVIDLDSNKIYGLIKGSLTDDTQKYSSIVFVPKEGKRSILYPKDIIAYSYLMYTFISYNNSFYEVVENGPKVVLYKKSKKILNTNSPQAQMYSGGIDKEIYFIKKVNETELIEFKKKDFDEISSTYFGDCKNLIIKINSKKLTYKNLPEIVKEYNWCR